MCLAEFAANYVTSYQNNDSNDDVLPSNDDIDSCDSKTKITLTIDHIYYATGIRKQCLLNYENVTNRFANKRFNK